MPSPAILDDELLAPIAGDNPNGTDLRSTDEWYKIRNARPDPFDSGDKGIWTKKNSSEIGWPQLFDKTATALKKKSKDLELAVWLTEATTHLHGFAGLRDSLRFVRELLLRFWDRGLFPPVDGDNLEERAFLLQTLNQRVADLVTQVPLTARLEGAPDYSYKYFLESRKAQGSITTAQFDEAARLTRLNSLETILEDCQLAGTEFRKLRVIAEQKFGAEAMTFTAGEEAFETCQDILEILVREKRPQTEPKSLVAAAGPVSSTITASNSGAAAAAALVSPAPDDATQPFIGNSWDAAEKLLRDGNVSEALAEMTRLASIEPNGRVRFHRKLLLVDICLSKQRVALAKSILEELAEIIDSHKLDEWETPQVIGAVWSRLYKCCKNKEAGTADPDRAEKLLKRLCRLDPWQAFACDSP